MPAGWGEVVSLPGNEAAVRAVRRLSRALTAGSRRLPPSPLVLHGPPGVGKSLLVRALVGELTSHPSGPTALTVPARELRGPSPDPADADDGFADLVGCDFLAVEDVHHLPAKSADVLCRLLDRRAARRRPTVATGAAGPANLPDLPRRLTTRLAAGLVVRVDPPDRADRQVLAEHLTARLRLPLTADALDWLAGAADGPRPLVGLIGRLRQTAAGHPGPLDRAAVEELVRDPAADLPPTAPLDRILARVAAAFGVRPKDITGPGRQRAATLARQVAMHLARDVVRLSLPRIGAYFGGRDHTTVLHAVRRVEAAMADDPRLRRTVADLAREVA